MLRKLFSIVVYTCVIVLVWGLIVLLPPFYTRTSSADNSSPRGIAQTVGLTSVGMFLLLWGIGVWIICKWRRKKDRCRGTVTKV